ncbi:hypothetical protein H8E77_31155, partial [bacterium]|nr:hypothetical protein [bacterium]
MKILLFGEKKPSFWVQRRSYSVSKNNLSPDFRFVEMKNSVSVPIIEKRRIKMFQKILIILAVIAIVFTYANIAKAQVVKDGLVSYWSFDKADTAGKTAKDIWGNNDGTMEGSPKVADGKI